MLLEIEQWTRLQESNYIYQKNCVGELCWNCVVSSETVLQTCVFTIISKVLREANSTQEKNNQCKRMIDIGLRIFQTNTLVISNSTKLDLYYIFSFQDGSYLAEFLLEKGYEVHGIIRRSSSFNTGRIQHLYKDRTAHLEGSKCWFAKLPSSRYVEVANE